MIGLIVLLALSVNLAVSAGGGVDGALGAMDRTQWLSLFLKEIRLAK